MLGGDERCRTRAGGPALGSLVGLGEMRGERGGGNKVSVEICILMFGTVFRPVMPASLA